MGSGSVHWVQIDRPISDQCRCERSVLSEAPFHRRVPPVGILVEPGGAAVLKPRRRNPAHGVPASTGDEVRTAQSRSPSLRTSRAMLACSPRSCTSSATSRRPICTSNTTCSQNIHNEFVTTISAGLPAPPTTAHSYGDTEPKAHLLGREDGSTSSPGQDTGSRAALLLVCQGAGWTVNRCVPGPVGSLPAGVAISALRTLV